jgi:hypothetical protein
MNTTNANRDTSAVEAKLARLLAEIIPADLGPALTGAVRPDGYDCAAVTARRGGVVSTVLVDLDVAATLSDEQLREEVLWSVGRAVDGLEDDDGPGPS